MSCENTVGKYTVHRLILTLVKRKTEIEENHYITLNSFCPFAHVMVNNLRDARICEIYLACIAGVETGRW